MCKFKVCKSHPQKEKQDNKQGLAKLPVPLIPQICPQFVCPQ